MQLIGEVLSIFWEVFKAFGKMIIELFPAVMELKQVMDMFTWEQMLAVYLGVPSIIITVVVFLIRRAIKYGRN